MKRYRIISELGKGATGVVWRAIKSDDSSVVALKKLVLPGHLDAREEEEFINRFKAEAKAALEMNHPGIVRALDCGLDEGTFFIAYELIEGITLEDAQKSGREFSPEETADIIVQASEALSYAHKQGVVHRDISPGNIFIGNDGKVRIADFGVARFVSRTEASPDSDAIVGTPGYMAPEQVTSADADPRSDIFALGSVAYELLTRQPAFKGENIAQVIHKVLNAQPVPIREINPKVPLALEELIFRMLAKNRDYRYQSMDEVSNAARKILDDFPRVRRKESVGEIGHAPRLACIEGPCEGSTFNLLPTVTTIGKSLGDILIQNDPDISPQHAWITKEETGWVLYDADSDNGTFLNGEKIEREELFPGDRIKIGATVLEFRGAGGHKGAFKESGESEEVAKPAVQPSSRKVALPIILGLAVLALITVFAIVWFAFLLPSGYMARLDAGTNARWASALSELETGIIGSDEWLIRASGIISKREGDTDVNYEDYFAPNYIFGHIRINDEIKYRFQLLNLSDEFIVDATAQAVAGNSGNPQAASSAAANVKALELKINGLKVPDGVTPQWEGRKNQLLSIVRKWEAGAGASAGAQPVVSKYKAELEQASSALLDGWYVYREAGDDFNLLSGAYDKFQSCYNSLTALLDKDSSVKGALALRGLTLYLEAKILKQVATPEKPDYFTKAAGALDDAEKDITGIEPDTWDSTIPRDFMSDFPSPTSLLSQIRALKRVIEENTPGTPSAPVSDGAGAAGPDVGGSG